LREVLTDIANELRDRGALDEEERFIDATFVMAKRGGAEIGATRPGRSATHPRPFATYSAQRLISSRAIATSSRLSGIMSPSDHSGPGTNPGICCGAIVTRLA